jgi:hypothetical protein
MSAPGSPVGDVRGGTRLDALVRRLPAWARPLERERPGLGSVRLAESTILVLIALLLAVATVHDLVLQTRVNHRLIADLSTWRVATGHRYHNITVEQDIERHTTRDTACGNVSPGAPGERTQVCLLLTGHVADGRRIVLGGYYLPPKTIDKPAYRYGCFGEAKGHALCGAKAPYGAPPPLPIRLGRPS